MRIIVATNNRGKLDELRALLPAGAELFTLADMGLDSPEETGSTFEENALLKARSAAPFADAALADDSGLEVDALGGRPGVSSARFSGPNATDAANNALLLEMLVGVLPDQRRARFTSAVALVLSDGTTELAVGHVDGRIASAPRGNGGFGYDPLFEIADDGAGELNGRTMAELSVAEKNAISHRGRAYRSLTQRIKQSAIKQNLIAGSLDVHEGSGTR